MKLLYIVNARLPTEKAHGYQITKMCEEFARAGAAVELWVSFRRNSIQEDIFSYYRLERNFAVKYLGKIDFIGWAKYFGRAVLYLQLFWFLLQLFFMNADKETLVYTRNPEVAWLFKLKGFRVAYECHQWFGRGRRVALFFLKNCDFIIVTNNYIKDEFIKSGIAGGRLLLAPNGINLSVFALTINKERAVSDLSIGSRLRNKIIRNRILLYTGGFKLMGVEKGIDEILAALKFFANRKVYFVAVGGDDKDIKYYRSLAGKLGISEQCVFLPRVSQKELARWQRAADILLMPFPRKAHYEYFMTPLKMFEYMAAGRPIIASGLPSIREVLNSKNAFFCRPGDARDLARIINYVLDHPNEAQKKAAQARQDVEQYTWQKRAKKILAFIAKARTNGAGKTFTEISL